MSKRSRRERERGSELKLSCADLRDHLTLLPIVRSSHHSHTHTHHFSGAARPNSLIQWIFLADGAGKRLNSPRLRRLRRQANNQQSAPDAQHSSHGPRHRRSHRLEHEASFADQFLGSGVRRVERMPALSASKSPRSPTKRITGLISTMLDGNSTWKGVAEQLENVSVYWCSKVEVND